jgi:hypothetical protein
MLTKRFLLVALSGAAMVFLAQAQTAQAHLVAEPIAAPMPTAAIGDCCAAQPDCCPKPCITYRHCGPKLCCGCCKPPVETVLKVKTPCTGCEIDVTACVPACCTGEPTVCCGIGFLGRPIVVYEWCCGYSVRVAFKHCGDVLVTTWGR